MQHHALVARERRAALVADLQDHVRRGGRADLRHLEADAGEVPGAEVQRFLQRARFGVQTNHRKLRLSPSGSVLLLASSVTRAAAHVERGGLRRRTTGGWLASAGLCVVQRKRAAKSF